MRAGRKVPTFRFGFTHNNPPQAPYTQPVPQGPFCPSRGHSTSAAFIPLAVGLLGGCMVGLHAERVSGAFRCGFMHTNSPQAPYTQPVCTSPPRSALPKAGVIPPRLRSFHLLLDCWGVVWLGCTPSVGAGPSDASLSAKIYPGQPEHNQSLKVPSAEAKAGLCVTALFFSDCAVRPYSVDSVKGRTLLRETCSRRALQDIVPTPQTVELPFAKARPSRDL